MELKPCPVGELAPEIHSVFQRLLARIFLQWFIVMGDSQLNHSVQPWLEPIPSMPQSYLGLRATGFSLSVFDAQNLYAEITFVYRCRNPSDKSITMKNIISSKFSVLAFILLAVVGRSWPTLALPADSVVLTATQDSYTDLNQPSANFNGQMLLTESTMGPPGQPDVPTRVIYLAFDLSSVSFDIKSATLSLSTLTCDGQLPLDSTRVDVHGIDNDPTNAWTEATLTWNNQPLPTAAALIGATSGSVGPLTWGDPAGGAFASWLESQRLANDGLATLLLKVDISAGNGIRDVFVEDREGSASGLGCPDASGPPQLTLDSETTLFPAFLPLITTP